jgi:hypothetical protein
MRTWLCAVCDSRSTDTGGRLTYAHRETQEVRGATRTDAESVMRAVLRTVDVSLQSRALDSSEKRSAMSS